MRTRRSPNHWALHYRDFFLLGASSSVWDRRLIRRPAKDEGFVMAPDWSQCVAVGSVPGTVSGAWVFRGTRMPVATVFEKHRGRG
jgi:hypothetical protein